MKPKISIITPTFNSSKTLKACLDSVSSQAYPHIEHWIVDGLSNDDTMTIVKEYAKEHEHLRYISEKDKGIYDAMNKGIDLASGEWIFFLGSDDYFKEGVLTKIFEQDYQDTHLLYGKIQGESTGVESGKPFDNTLLMTGMALPHQGTFTRKKTFEITGQFELKYRLCADRHMFMKTFSNKELKTVFIDEVIATYGEEGASAQTVDKAFLFEYKDNLSELYNIQLSPKENFYMTGMYYFEEIYKGTLSTGIKGTLKHFFKTGNFKAIKDGLYWYKKRLALKKEKSQ